MFIPLRIMQMKQEKRAREQQARLLAGLRRQKYLQADGRDFDSLPFPAFPRVNNMPPVPVVLPKSDVVAGAAVPLPRPQFFTFSDHHERLSAQNRLKMGTVGSYEQ
jgi:hypothetical protein